MGPCRAFPRTRRVYISISEVWFVRLVFKFLSCCDVILEVVFDWMGEAVQSDWRVKPTILNPLYAFEILHLYLDRGTN